MGGGREPALEAQLLDPGLAVGGGRLRAHRLRGSQAGGAPDRKHRAGPGCQEAGDAVLLSTVSIRDGFTG